MSWRSKLSRNLMEVTLRCCNDTPSSAGTRAFVLSNFNELTELNPKFPFLIREADNVAPHLEVVFHPKVYHTEAGYKLAYPVNRTEDLTDMSEAEVLAVLKRVVEEGASTPEVTSEVPKPIAEALCEDMHGRHADIRWPSEALNYSHSKMENEALLGDGPIGRPS